MQRRTLYIIIGAVVILLIGIGIGIFTLSVITSANVKGAPTPTPIAATTAKKGNAAAQLLRQYAPDIKTQIAQGLNLTPDQLTTQLQAGKTLSDIAAAQGIPSTQLPTLIQNTLENALKPAVNSGDLTQTQLDRLAKRYAANPALLDRFLGGSTKGTKRATPAATPAQ
jgi:hypothetical protein